MTEHGTSGPSGPAQHIARLAALVRELEELSRSTDVPPSLLAETRASLERARKALENSAPPPERAAPAEQDDSDPQPDVDRDILDRMYRIPGANRRQGGR